jgi:hypothetical protein
MGFAALNPSYTLDVPAILIPRFERKERHLRYYEHVPGASGTILRVGRT